MNANSTSPNKFYMKYNKYLQRHQHIAPRLKVHSSVPASQARYISIDVLICFSYDGNEAHTNL